MGRLKQQGRRRPPVRHTPVPDSISPGSSRTSTPLFIPETPQHPSASPTLNGNSHFPRGPPTSGLPLSPTPSHQEPAVSTPDVPQISQMETPVDSQSHNHASETADGSMDELHMDAVSLSSSKRKRSVSLDVTPPSHARDKRLRLQPNPPIKLDPDDFNPPYRPLTDEERLAWKGWVEVLSEPLYVNTMLRELGVQGVRAAEIHELDTGILTLEPPVYGLIFCFQYQDSDHHAGGQGEASRPGDVWFANQLPATNACATIAMINILLNAPRDVELGNPLRFFKEDTRDLTPMERAHCINEHEFIRAVHNSHASRVDMWIADRAFASKFKDQQRKHEKRLRDEERALDAERKAAEKAARDLEREKENPSPSKQQQHQGTPVPARPKRKPASAKKKKAKYASEDENENENDSSEEQVYDDESAYHYVAYVPAAGHIWRLDGMSGAPQDLGPYTHEDAWLYDAAPHIRSRMQEFPQAGAGLFNLMALVKDAASRAREGLAASARVLVAVEEALGRLGQGLTKILSPSEKVVRGADEELGVTEAMIAAAPSPPAELATLRDEEKLLKMRDDIVKEQTALMDTIRTQKRREANEQLRVEKDRLDLIPMIHKLLLDLEENGVANEFMEVHRQ